MARKLVKPAYHDPDNSVDLFDADRQNEWGEMYCVAPAILTRQVEQMWEMYCVNLYDDAASENHTGEELAYL